MPKFAANLTMLFTEHAFLDRFERAAQGRLRGRRVPVPLRLRARSRSRSGSTRTGLKLVLHNLPAGDWDAGERGIACHPDRVAEFREGVAKAIDYAKALGVPQLNCLAGKAPAGVAGDVLRTTLVENLRHRRRRAEAGRPQAADRADQHLRHSRAST